jgi:Lar family restriction alleviation protein
MSPFTNLGPGDESTWPPYSGHPGDPRAPDDVDITDDDEWTNAKTDRCPFCGDEGQVEETGLGTFMVVCEGCGAEGPRRTDPQEAVEAWDHRQPANRPIPSIVRRQVVSDLITELQEQQ